MNIICCIIGIVRIGPLRLLRIALLGALLTERFRRWHKREPNEDERREIALEAERIIMKNY